MYVNVFIILLIFCCNDDQRYYLQTELGCQDLAPCYPLEQTTHRKQRMTVSFNEMNRFHCEFLVILSANLNHCITADQTHPLHFLEGSFCFGGCILMITLGSKENSNNFL
jgi:hypothetical protein